MISFDCFEETHCQQVYLLGSHVLFRSQYELESVKNFLSVNVMVVKKYCKYFHPNGLFMREFELCL